MSDQLDGQVQDRPVTPEQEDPLAELARIVSGDGSAVVNRNRFQTLRVSMIVSKLS